MKRVTTMVGLGLAAMLLGCTNTPNMETKSMETVKLSDGKSYSVPVGSSYTNKPVPDKAIAFYQKVGVTSCTKGDITWEDASVADEINAILRTGSKEGGIELYKKSAAEGTIGCASPLN